MEIKRKVNDRGNGSCQIVVPKKVMEHLKIVPREEVEFVLIPDKEYVVLKKYKELKPKNISLEKFLKEVKEFTLYLSQNKKNFFQCNLTGEYYQAMNTALMLSGDNTTIKIIEFLIVVLEDNITGMYGCDFGRYEKLAEDLIGNTHQKVIEMTHMLNNIKELKEPEGFEQIINDLSIMVESYYSKSWKIAAIEVIVEDNLKEPSVDFETKIELIKVCMNLLEEAGEENKDTELIQEFLEKALNSVYEEN